MADRSAGFLAPAPSPKAILEAYPTSVELLLEATAGALGRLTWPVIIRNVEPVIMAIAESA